MKRIIIFMLLFKVILFSESFFKKLLPDESHLDEYNYVEAEGVGVDEKAAKNDAVKKAGEKKSIKVKAMTLVDKKMLKEDRVQTSSEFSFDGIEIINTKVDKKTGLVRVTIKAKYKNPKYDPNALQKLKNEFNRYRQLNELYKLKTAYINPKKIYIDLSIDINKLKIKPHKLSFGYIFFKKLDVGGNFNFNMTNSNLYPSFDIAAKLKVLEIDNYPTVSGGMYAGFNKYKNVSTNFDYSVFFSSSYRIPRLWSIGHLYLDSTRLGAGYTYIFKNVLEISAECMFKYRDGGNDNIDITFKILADTTDFLKTYLIIHDFSGFYIGAIIYSEYLNKF